MNQTGVNNSFLFMRDSAFILSGTSSREGTTSPVFFPNLGNFFDKISEPWKTYSFSHSLPQFHVPSHALHVAVISFNAKIRKGRRTEFTRGQFFLLREKISLNPFHAIHHTPRPRTLKRGNFLLHLHVPHHTPPC